MRKDETTRFVKITKSERLMILNSLSMLHSCALSIDSLKGDKSSLKAFCYTIRLLMERFCEENWMDDLIENGYPHKNVYLPTKLPTIKQ